MYQVSQTSLPAYFNYSRWVCSFVLAFTLSIIVLAIFTHPKLFNNSLDKNRKFWISIFGVSGFMVFTGLAGISAGAWFSYACYANKLGPLIGPGSETTNFQNVSFYTPYWCCVLWIIVMCFMIVVGGVFGCRTCCNSGLDENVDVVVFDGEYPEKKTRMEQYKTEKYGNANESESKSYTSSSSRSTDSESGNGHDNNTYSAVKSFGPNTVIRSFFRFSE